MINPTFNVTLLICNTDLILTALENAADLSGVLLVAGRENAGVDGHSGGNVLLTIDPRLPRSSERRHAGGGDTGGQR